MTRHRDVEQLLAVGAALQALPEHERRAVERRAALDLLGELEWTCRCEQPGSKPPGRIFQRWACPWCGQVFEFVEVFSGHFGSWLRAVA